MKKIPGKIRAVLLVMVIAFSGVFLAPGAASAFNYDIEDSAAVCYAKDGDGNGQTMLLVNGLYEQEKCETFSIPGGDIFSYLGWCGNYGDHAYLDVACAEGNVVTDWEDWNNREFWIQTGNCIQDLQPGGTWEQVWVMDFCYENSAVG